MAIISKETFEKFTKEEKDKLRKDYDDLIYFSEHATDEYLRNEAPKTLKEYERLFGKENLKPESMVKTWEDINKMDNRYHKLIDEIIRCGYSSLWGSKVINKVIATIKIVKLIELGYGGTITLKEWDDKRCTKYGLLVRDGKLDVWQGNSNIHEIVTFHTREQREEFMSYPENVELVEQYFMI